MAFTYNLPPSMFRLQSTAFDLPPFILVSKSANIHSLHSIHFTIMSSQHQLTSHYLHCHFCLVFAILHLQLGFCQRSAPQVQECKLLINLCDWCEQPLSNLCGQPLSTPCDWSRDIGSDQLRKYDTVAISLPSMSTGDEMVWR